MTTSDNESSAQRQTDSVRLNQLSLCSRATFYHRFLVFLSSAHFLHRPNLLRQLWHVFDGWHANTSKHLNLNAAHSKKKTNNSHENKTEIQVVITEIEVKLQRFLLTRAYHQTKCFLYPAFNAVPRKQPTLGVDTGRASCDRDLPGSWQGLQQQQGQQRIRTGLNERDSSAATGSLLKQHQAPELGDMRPSCAEST